MQIYFSEDYDEQEGLTSLMEKAASSCVKNEGLDPSVVSLSVSFADAAQIQTLNRDYRGVDRVTDVLSFPMYERAEIEEMAASDKDELLDEIEIGDVVICMDKVLSQAEELGHSRERETLYLFTHSVLHLLGYDHEEDADRQLMRQKEESVMESLGLKQEDD